MSDTNKNIAKSVALKAAIDLAKDEFSMTEDLSAQVEKIITVSDKFYDYLLDGTIDAVGAVFDYEEKEIDNSKPRDVVKVGTTFEPKCPECNSKVYDNRQTAQGKQPLWKCSNKNGCDTGKGYPWDSWDENEYANLENKILKQNDTDFIEKYANEPGVEQEPPF